MTFFLPPKIRPRSYYTPDVPSPIIYFSHISRGFCSVNIGVFFNTNLERFLHSSVTTIMRAGPFVIFILLLGKIERKAHLASIQRNALMQKCSVVVVHAIRYQGNETKISGKFNFQLRYEMLDFSKSEDSCRASGGHLAYVSEVETNEFLANAFGIS